MKNYIYLILTISIFAFFTACENVEEGYTVNYGETSAVFTVELNPSNKGSEGDVAVFTIEAQSENEIKSIVVTYDDEEAIGSSTGYVVDSVAGDPLVDHNLGTIQPGTTSLYLQYYFEFPSDTVDNALTFTLIDSEGKAEKEFEMEAIPGVATYDSVVLVAQKAYLLDGFSTADGTVYENLDDYEDVTVGNLSVQESIDIIFIVNSDDGKAKIYCPYYGIGIDFENLNKTLFKRLDSLSSDDFDNLTNITLSEIVDEYQVKKGSTIIDSVYVGDIIGFRTDLASSNSYHYGILRVNALHPTNVDRYDGKSYLIEMDVITQQ